ncbi:MAG: tRNA pseudouridine(38-40) synthase TruA [Candidatus Thermoplasmatota archaeon]|nr:tRNA pseudouridine(38-40) synthase TruA [Candidatus Thermoplasmatota archaeon]
MPKTLALKFAYDGTKFDGFAVQPHGKTVEGEIIKALRAIGIKSSPRPASRTDKWVSARGNVMGLETDFPAGKLVKALNGILENIWFYAVADAPADFKPRHANWRLYRYIMPNEKFDVPAMKRCAEMLVGEHDFSALAKKDEDKNPKRNILSASVSKKGKFIILELKAQSFLWSMVRGIAELMKEAGRKKVGEDSILKILAGERKSSLHYAPPENLVLLDVHYDKLKFRNIREAVRKMKKEIGAELEKAEARQKILQAIVH